jgi:hypothetical protein
MSKLDYQPRKTRTWRDEAVSTYHRFVHRFTRDNIISNLKTLAWVVPLTLLIWIYAEREQVATTKDVSVPFEAVSIDPNVSIKVMSPPDQNLVLELQGPQARLQDVLGKLRGGMLPLGLKIEIPTTLEKNRVHPLMALELVRNQKIFNDNGVTVLSCQPARIDVMLDAIVERDAKITRPPTVTNVDGTFTPAMVKVRGPSSVIDAAEKRNAGQLLIWADLDQIARSPAGPVSKEIGLRKPPELDDDRVVVTGASTVKADVEVRRADEKLLIRSMPITADAPDALWDKYKLVWEKPTQPVLQNVTVSGPPDVIKAIAQLDSEVKPKARLVVTQQDAGDRRSKVVKYDLPDGVTVSDEDKTRTVDFRLVSKDSLPPTP